MPSAAKTTSAVSIHEIVKTNLQLKNAFTQAGSTGAASAGTAVEAAFKTFDRTIFSAVRKKTFEGVEGDAFKMMHKSARLSKNDKTIVINWVQQSKDVQNVKE